MFLLLSGKTFQTKQIRADTSHEVSALLVIFVLQKNMAVFIISNSTPLELKPHLLEDEMIRVKQEKFLSIQ